MLTYVSKPVEVKDASVYTDWNTFAGSRIAQD